MVHGLVEEAQDILYSKLIKVNINVKQQVNPQQVLPIY
jgi:hypothetical protein